MSKLSPIPFKQPGTLAQDLLSRGTAAPKREANAAETFTTTVSRDAGRGARLLSALPRHLSTALVGGIASPTKAQRGLLGGVARTLDAALQGIGMATGGLLGAAVGVAARPLNPNRAPGVAQADYAAVAEYAKAGVDRGAAWTHAASEVTLTAVVEVARLLTAAVSGAVAAVGCVLGAAVGVAHVGARLALRGAQASGRKLADTAQVGGRKLARAAQSGGRKVAGAAQAGGRKLADAAQAGGRKLADAAQAGRRKLAGAAQAEGRTAVEVAGQSEASLTEGSSTESSLTQDMGQPVTFGRPQQTDAEQAQASQDLVLGAVREVLERELQGQGSLAKLIQDEVCRAVQAAMAAQSAAASAPVAGDAPKLELVRDEPAREEVKDHDKVA